MIDAIYQLLARIGFTDPLHAPVTHIPIGLVIGGALFFYVAVIFKKKNLYLTARHVSILAFIFVFPTILLGVIDWLHFFKGALIPPIKMKMILATCVLLLLGTGIILGSEVKVRNAPMMVIWALAVLGVVGLGWYGARLVYGNWAGSQPAAEAAAPAAPATGAGAGTGAAPASSVRRAPGGAAVCGKLRCLSSGRRKRRCARAAVERGKAAGHPGRFCLFHKESRHAEWLGRADAGVPGGPGERQGCRGHLSIHPGTGVEVDRRT